ncbi:MAG: hypothetical protein MUF72_13425 [Elainella sp. Prado103]|jgi:hypothetical protein|nr:hypothetical protein [Elainella sp. Prado103]
MGKTVLGGICTGIALLVAVRAPNQSIQVTATVVAASLLSYTTTSYLLECKRQHKTRLADAEAYLDFLRQINQDRLTEVVSIPETCQGCCHYHGQVYGGNRLICAMHPYGVEEDRCPDWEDDR